MSIARFASKYLAIAAFLTAPWMPKTALAANWSSTNVHYLYGWNFEPSLSKEKHGTVTLEHASGFAYGDNFFFLDVSNGVLEDNDVASTLYGQWNPRFSLSRITGAPLALGPITDVLLTGELGYGAGGGLYQREYCGGIGFDVKIPGFAYFGVNFWLRHTDAYDDVTYHFAPYWGAPFAVGQVGFLFEGFLDLIGPEGDSEMWLISQPRLLVDVGSLWKKPGNLFLGTEVAINWNAYGIKDKEEYVPQLMTKWVF